LAYHSTISLSSVKARKARARDVGGCMAHSPRKGDRESWGEGGSMHSTISFSSAPWACNDGMAVVSSKWDTGQD